MGRPPLPLGTFGKIDFLVIGPGRIRAGASFRDYDGRRRYVTRYGSTRAQAERRLREALRDRGTGATPPVPLDSRLSALAARWLTEVDDSDRSTGTRRLYRFVLQAYVLPGIGELRLRARSPFLPSTGSSPTSPATTDPPPRSPPAASSPASSVWPSATACSTPIPSATPRCAGRPAPPADHEP